LRKTFKTIDLKKH